MKLKLHGEAADSLLISKNHNSLGYEDPFEFLIEPHYKWYEVVAKKPDGTYHDDLENTVECSMEDGNTFTIYGVAENNVRDMIGVFDRAKVAITIKDLFNDTLAKMKEVPMSNAWLFVEKFYPNYSRCAEIARNNDLQVIVDREVTDGSSAQTLFAEDFKNDYEQAEISLVYSNAAIYELAIKGFLKQHPEILRGT